MWINLPRRRDVNAARVPACPRASPRHHEAFLQRASGGSGKLGRDALARIEALGWRLLECTFLADTNGSHNPAEAMDMDDFLLGCEVLWRTVTERA